MDEPNRPPDQDRRPSRGPWIAAVLLGLAVGLPFLNKPFHIDDPYVLNIAEQVLRAPLKPFSGQFNWFDDVAPVFDTVENPPFLSYYLAPFLAVFGPSEIMLHVAMLPFLVLLAGAVVALSRRFTRGSFWPVLFVMLSPAVVVSTNIMRDVPAAALATAGVALLVEGADRDRMRLALLGGLLAGLAMVTKYSAIVLLPILTLYPILQLKPKYLLALAPAVLILGLWYLQNHLVHGQVHFLYLISKPKPPVPFDWYNKAAAAAVITGASFFVLPGLLAGAIRRRDALTPGGGLVAVLAAALMLFSHLQVRYSANVNAGNLSDHYWGYMQYFTWGLLGAITAYWMAATGLFANTRWRRISEPSLTVGPPRSAVERRGPTVREGGSAGAPDERESEAGEIEAAGGCRGTDALFLLVWMIGPYLCGVFFVGFPAVRHILPAAAPIALLAVAYTQVPRGATNSAVTRWAVRIAFAIGLLIQAGLAFWTAAADYQYADSYRHFAHYVAEKYGEKNQPAGAQVWFMGHWGWQHYAAQNRLRQVTLSGPVPQPGDIIASPVIVHKGALPKALEGRLELIEEKRYPARLNMLTMDWMYAGFYNTSQTMSPSRIVKGKDYEIFQVFRVKKAK
jgi:hypothetical protein